jgi:hypothetical protein
MAKKTREEEIREFADNWYGASRETEESAFAHSRSNLWQASLVERQDPSQCRLLRNHRRSALRRGADPATVPDELATQLRNQAAFYAEIAKRATDYPARNRQRLQKDTLVWAERNKQRWDEETKQLRSIDPDQWRAHWIRGYRGWRGNWQDTEDPREGALAISRYHLESANMVMAHAHPESAAAGRAAYSRKLSEIHAELADKLPRQGTQAAVEKTPKSVYDEAIEDGWNPEDWIMSQQNPKEAAVRYSRQYLETAERVEKRDPAESTLIENWRKGTLLRGEDPETAVSKCIEHLHKLGDVYADLAKHAPDDAGRMRIKEEAIRRDREKMVREHQEETQRLESIDPREALHAVRECGHAAELEFYNMLDGWQFRLPLANKMRSFLKLFLAYVNNRAVNDPEWFHSAVAAYYSKRHDLYVAIAETLHAEHATLTTTKED